MLEIFNNKWVIIISIIIIIIIINKILNFYNNEDVDIEEYLIKQQNYNKLKINFEDFTRFYLGV
jgi:hypothetical protein